MSYFYELCILFDNNNINNYYEFLSPLLIRSYLIIFLCFLITSWLKSLISSISFIWNSKILHESFIFIVIVLQIWFLLLSNLDRSFSIRLYLMILFQYLYYHSSDVINWFSLVMLKLDRFKLFKSIIFDFFTVLFSFFHINNMPPYTPSGCFASGGLSATNVILLSCSFFISLLCFYCF